jgi:hypothetical protein
MCCGESLRGCYRYPTSYFGRVVRLRGPDSSDQKRQLLSGFFSTGGGPSCRNDDKIAYLPRERRFLTAIALPTFGTWFRSRSSVVLSPIPRHFHRQVGCFFFELLKSPKRTAAYHEFDGHRTSLCFSGHFSSMLSATVRLEISAQRARFECIFGTVATAHPLRCVPRKLRSPKIVAFHLARFIHWNAARGNQPISTTTSISIGI